jgi:hypothetical protein
MQNIQSNYEKPIFFQLSEDLNTINGVDVFYSIGALRISRLAKNQFRYTPFNGFLGDYGGIARYNRHSNFLTRENWKLVGRIYEYGGDNVVLEMHRKYQNTMETYKKQKKKCILLLTEHLFIIYTQIMLWDG